ncbi:unnamed protein product [Eruca vesicaria subsp. sativa]|uniref:Pre-mRNA polyadenylation factor Fip1 domain-containing protein n=1 Tax=Eruca vesicaria subsp. sativa TaxID=29727 RepID=A0ABC8LSH0_ERUVS|nr:unnamed protein product [Eruca vesicaria subsp. sativa]
MDEDDEFGDLYSDVLQPFHPPPPPPLRTIDLNLRSEDQVAAEPNSPPVARVSITTTASKPSTTLSQDANRKSIDDDDDKEMNFDIEDDSTPTIPGLSTTDRQSTTALIEKVAGDGGYGGGDDWEDSDSEDDLQIVLNDNNSNVMMGRARMRGNEEEEEDDDDEEQPLVIVTDADPNQAMEEQQQLWGEEGAEGDGKEGEAVKGSAAGTVKAGGGYSSHGYHHPFHSQFKYVRPGAAPTPGAAAGTSSGQVRPPANLGPMAGRGRGDWRPMGMRNASAAQKGFHQTWGGNTAGRGLDFTLPSHKTIFEFDIETFEEKPWRYQGVDITDYFNFGLNEETWKDYCKQLDQRRIETTMQSRIRVYESGRTDQGYDPDLPPELAAATGAQGVPVDSSNLVKLETAQGDSANIRPPLPPGRPIPVETGSGERPSSIDTRAPRMRDLEAIIEIVCEDFHEDEPSGENGAEQADNSLPEDNAPVETGYVNSERPDTESAKRVPAQDRKKQDDEISRSTDSGQSFRSSSPVGDRGTRSSSFDREDVEGEAGKDAEMEEEHKMNSAVPRSAVEEDDGGESKTERSSESSKARSGSHRDHQQLKDGAEEEVIQDKKHFTRPASNKKHHVNNAPHQSRKYHDRGKEMERTRAGSKGGSEYSNPHIEVDPRYINSTASGEDFDKRKERVVDGGVWRRKEDDIFSRRGGDEGSRKRDRGDDLGSRQRGKVRESQLRSKDDHVPSRNHVDDGGLRNNYELDDHISKRRKDEEYLRRHRSEKNENAYSQRESISRLKRERGDRLDHQKRDVHDIDDHASLRHRDDFYMQRDGNERLREREDLDKLKQSHEDGLSARGRERQVSAKGRRGSEDRSSSRIKDEYKASDKEHLTKDTTRQTKQTKRREYPGEESSSHHRGHEDFSARTDDIVNHEKKPRTERTSVKSDKVVDSLDDQKLQDRKHKDSRRKTKEQRESTDSLRNKQGEQNGSSEVTGLKGTNEARKHRNEIPQQPNATKRRRENASSGDELQDSKRGRTKFERWGSHKERDDAVTAKGSSSTPSKTQEKEKGTNGRASEPLGKNRDVTEEKSGHDLAETKDGSQKGQGDRHLDTVEKLKKRSERFKLPMPTEKDNNAGVKKLESETLPSAKIEGPADSEVKAERPARKRRWTSS